MTQLLADTPVTLMICVLLLQPATVREPVLVLTVAWAPRAERAAVAVVAPVPPLVRGNVPEVISPAAWLWLAAAAPISAGAMASPPPVLWLALCAVGAMLAGKSAMSDLVWVWDFGA